MCTKPQANLFKPQIYEPDHASRCDRVFKGKFNEFLFCARQTVIQPIVWIHDGFLVSPAPTESQIRQVEAQVLTKYQLYFDHPWYKNQLTCSTVHWVCHQPPGHGQCSGVKPSPADLPQANHKKHAAVGLPQTCLAPLEALVKVRARWENGNQPNDSTLHLQKAWMGAWRLRGGFKPFSRRLQGGLKGASRGLQKCFKGYLFQTPCWSAGVKQSFRSDCYGYLIP